MALTFALGLYHAGRPELWRDELRSWSAASRSLGQIVQLLGNTDAAAGLYYLALHFWMQIFGDSGRSMRLLSAVAMTGAAIIVSLIAQRLFDRRTAIAAGMIFAVIPSVSRYAQEVRPYALTMLLATAATLLLLRLIERPSYGRLLAYAITLTGLALTQIVAMPLLLAHAVGIALWRGADKRLVWKWGGAVVLGLLLAAPVVMLSTTQYANQVGSLPDATVGELTRLPGRLFASYLVAGALVMLAIFAFGSRLRSAVFAAAWAVLPIGGIWIASNLGQSYWMTRYMLFTLPGFALLAAAAVMTLRLRTAVLAVALIAALGVQDQRAIRWEGAHDQWNYPEFSNQALFYSAAAGVIADNMRPGDAVAYANRKDFWLLDIGLAYYLRGKPQPRDVFVEQTALARANFWPTECPLPAKCLDDSVQRIWVLSALTPGVYDNMETNKKVILEYFYTIEKKYSVSGITLVLLQRKPI